MKIVLTGASSGIGAALLKALAEDGHEIFACARRIGKLRGVARGIHLAHTFRCDVSRERDVRSFVRRVRGRTRAVDALILAAGGFGAIGPADKTRSAQWEQALRTNLLGTFYMVKYALPLLRRGRGRRIIAFSGGGAFDPFPYYSAYACSKAAVVRLVECLAMELREEGISVCAVAPGFVATEIHRGTLKAGPRRAGREFYEETVRMLREGGKPMSAAIGCIRFLLSPEASPLTGKTISANFDPWRKPAFLRRMEEVQASPLYTLRRVNLADLPASRWRDELLEEGPASFPGNRATTTSRS